MVALLVILAITFMVAIDYFIIKKKRNAEVNPAFASPEIFNKNSMLAPEGYYFSKGHTWAKLGTNNEFLTGIDDFVIKSLGKISIESFTNVGTKVKKGDIIMEGKFDSKKIMFRSPVEGIIKKVNNALVGKIINNPYEGDWYVNIEPVNAEDSKKELLQGNEAIEWMKNEFKKLKEFLNYYPYKPKLAGVTMYDGGNVMKGAVSHLDEIGLRDFEEMFLML